MNKHKIIAFFLTWITMLAAISQANAQPLSKDSIIGKWNLVGVITDGELMPLDSDESLINYMLSDGLAKKKKKEGPTATLTKSDTTSILLAGKVVLPMRNSNAEFKNKGKFLFSLVYTFGQSIETKGFWQLNEATQTILVSEKADDKNEDFVIMKISKRGNQLILQLPDQKEEDGYLLSKKN